MIKNKVKLGVLVVSLACAGSVRGNDIFIGTRGPTPWQFDARVGYSEKTDSKDATTKTINQNDVLKYWNGNKIGLFGYVNVPAYKKVDNGRISSEGFGDIAFGLGPRGTIYLDGGKSGTLHFLSYTGAILPTAEVKTPALGNDRFDIKSGASLTYLTPQKKMEIDLAVDYICAGKNSRGVQGPDLISGGLIVGGQVFDNKDLELRLAGGINGILKENLKEKDRDYVYGPRAVLRITPKFKSGKKWGHLEVIGDYDACSKNMPKGFGLTFQTRVNF